MKIIGDVAASNISSALFDNNYQYGIQVKSGGALTVSGATFRNHTDEKVPGKGAAVYANDSTISLSDIIFNSNTLFDIRGAGGYSVPCTNCGTPSTDPDPL